MGKAMQTSRHTSVIGILGGMGPAATADLFQKIIELTPARRDQEHLRVIIDNNPHIPDRTAALKGVGESPLPMMLKSARILEAAKVDFIVVPCNTAHYFVRQLEPELKVPVLNMIEASVDFVTKCHPGTRSCGLLASTGTVISGVYENAFRERGIKMIVPDENEQETLVMEAIYGDEGIKAGGRAGAPRRNLRLAATSLQQKGVEIILMACTEIPLALLPEDADVPLLDTTAILAKATVERALDGWPGTGRSVEA